MQPLTTSVFPAHDLSLDGLMAQDSTVASRHATSLAPTIRASLNAKLSRLLERPIIAGIIGSENDAGDRSIASEPAAGGAHRVSAWTEDPQDGTFSVRISLDYEGKWRGREKEILETVSSTVEGAITFLTNDQKILLERSPREFLALNPRPESAELISFDRENVGGSVRVVALRVASAPESRAHVRHLAIVPNLVQIERQLDALKTIEGAADDSAIAPLRVLVGLVDASVLPAPRSDAEPSARLIPASDERLDEYQFECLQKAMDTPHFVVIQGPPGSGKTTVISGIVRRAVARGDRILIVSPTHVAVDNVVEKLAPREDAPHEDSLEVRTLPLRYAARPSKLSARALEYWVGSKKQKRGATVARRVQRSLTRTIPFAEALFAMENKDASGRAPISSAVAGVETVVCGTPIGILSFEIIKKASAGSFDLLIVDEVSKMTLPEFLAIAVKARRWVLVGDPQQLPPYNDSEENATTLDEVLDSQLELACTLGAVLDRVKPFARRDERLVVVSSDPTRTLDALRAHFAAVWRDNVPNAALLADATGEGIVVCSAEECDAACEFLDAAHDRAQGRGAVLGDATRIVVERGLVVSRSEVAGGPQIVEARARAQAQIFDNSFNVYHARPWCERSGQKLAVVMLRNALEKILPSVGLLASLSRDAEPDAPADERRRALIELIALRYAMSCVSVYDWLTGVPAEHLDVSPLRELEGLSSAALRGKVQPFVGTLRKQYRMHSSLSRVPRELFYFNDALHDGVAGGSDSCRVQLVHVEGDPDEAEVNTREVAAVCSVLETLNSAESTRRRRPNVMIITPYRKQEAALERAIGDLLTRGTIANLEIEVCTLDRCQGREAEYVLISLVRRRASTFLDMPKRWNVALTRAMENLFIVGNIDAYRGEARKARQDPRALPSAKVANPKQGRVLMSLLAAIVEAYDRQIVATRQGTL